MSDGGLHLAAVYLIWQVNGPIFRGEPGETKRLQSIASAEMRTVLLVRDISSCQDQAASRSMWIRWPYGGYCKTKPGMCCINILG